MTAPGRTLALHSRTQVELPLLQVRATSWIAEQGEETARTMILAPDGAWLERGGTRSVLPNQLAIHERQQFAIYAWLIVVQQQRRRPGRLALSAPPYPDIVFEIGADGYPTSAALTVDAPEPDRPRIAERVIFAGRIDSKGIRWPRRFDLAQDSKPYFSLDVDRFVAT